VDRELEALTRMLKSPPIFPWVKLRVLKHATLERVAEALDKPFDILHFIGHGSYDRHKERGFLLFETEGGGERRVSGRDLAPLLTAQPSLALVVLNACESGRASEMDAFAGVAQSLGDHGLGAVLAMQFPVADEAALVFSKTFYHSLFRGKGLDRAVHDARRRLFVSELKAEFGNPVLYLQKEWGGPSPLPKLAIAGLLMALLVYAWWLLPPHPFVTSDPGCPSILGMPFARVPAGSVLIPDPEDKKKIQSLWVDQPFCISKFEVSQRQWKRLGLKSNSRLKDRDHPVEGVAWTDADVFVRRLNEKDRRRHYRLPSLLEWRRAAQAGGIPDPAEMTEFGNCYGKDAYQKTSPVASFKPNSLGIYDLFGNVSEWLDDDYFPRGGGPPRRMSRIGGSFRNKPEVCLSLEPTGSPLGRHYEAIGVRIVSDVMK
jgi:CHAT domain-containing protein/sulfatase-modifying factor enzyme 1